MTVVFTNTRTESNTPQPNSSLDDSVVEVLPLFDKTLLKVVEPGWLIVVDPGTVDLSLQLHA